MSFQFETHDVPVKTSVFVRERQEKGRGACVYGSIGTGKSHAVYAAVPNALHVDVGSGPLLGLRFAADLARQLGPEGRRVLEAVRSEGLTAAMSVAEPAVNGHPFVVDRAERLLSAPSNVDDPTTVLWQQDKATVLTWVRERLNHSPTILVSRKRLFEGEDAEAICHHVAPKDWPIKLQRAPDGFRDWPTIGQLAKGNPAVLTLAQALVPLLSADDFNELVRQAKDDEVTGGGLLRLLGGAFQRGAPPSWQQALALLDALGEVPQDALSLVLAERKGRDLYPSERNPSIKASSALDQLAKLQLIEVSSRGLSVLPALTDAGAVRALTEQERSDLLPAVAHQLTAPINDLRSLDPEHADRVLRAHSIFVELGDMQNAERTAALHVHGLVELARRTSMNEDHPGAWQQYDNVLRLMQAGPWVHKDEAGRRLFSYVRHYRAFNGSLAGVLDDATCLEEYQASLLDWPGNALWHQRVAQAFIRLGRLVDTRRAVEEAYEQVAEHPLRDELLRVRPAHTAMGEGAPLFSLELVEPLLKEDVELVPPTADALDVLLRRWAQGIFLPELPFSAEDGAKGCVVFMREAKVSVQRASIGWVARLTELARDGRAPSPLAAVEVLGRDLSKEAYRLIATPSSNLGVQDVRRKGRLLSLVDALNSDIGLEHAEGRWLVGRIEEGKFVPTMRDLPLVELPQALLPESTAGQYFARVPVSRDGVPSGPVEALKPAGSGRGLGDLLALLGRISEDEA